LSNKPWLLRGEAKPSRFGEFTISNGEVFCSGDYEAATDNFVPDVSLNVLLRVLDTATHIPPGVKSMALGHIACNTLVYEGSSVLQQSGQLMGDYLSFPLLCLVNFLAFKFSVPRKVPLKINGDDIVFRATPEEVEVWSRNVVASGLTLSKGKTLIHRVFFSLNSTFFQAGYKKASLVPVIRAKSVYAALEKGGPSLKGRLHDCAKGFWSEAKNLVKYHLLRFHRKGVKRVPCSLNRGLDAKVAPATLKACGLLDHEIHYMQFPAACDNPPPGRKADSVPEGWRRREVNPLGNRFVRTGGGTPYEANNLYLASLSAVPDRVSKEDMKASEKEFGEACYQHAWSTKGLGAAIEEGLWMGFRQKPTGRDRGAQLYRKMVAKGDKPVSLRFIQKAMKAYVRPTEARIDTWFQNHRCRGRRGGVRRLWEKRDPLDQLKDPGQQRAEWMLLGEQSNWGYPLSKSFELH